MEHVHLSFAVAGSLIEMVTLKVFSTLRAGVETKQETIYVILIGLKCRANNRKNGSRVNKLSRVIKKILKLQLIFSMSSKRKYAEEGEIVEKKVQLDEYPTVSIIVALYNAAPYLEECLLSILSQNYKGSIEVSIHDDASTDNSVPVLEV